jgi:hypothetical protein
MAEESLSRLRSAFPVIELRHLSRGRADGPAVGRQHAMHAGVALPPVEGPLCDPAALLWDAITVFRNATPLEASLHPTNTRWYSSSRL